MIFILLICYGVFYGSECGLSWQMFQVSSRRMYILLWLDEAIFRCQLGLINGAIESAC